MTPTTDQPAIGTPFQQSLGLRWLVPDDQPDAVAVELNDDENDLRGPAGSLEGGIVSTLIDVAGASVAASATRSMVATEHISTSFLAPGRIGPFRAVGTLLRTGRNDAVAEVRVTDLGKDNRLMAVALVSVRLLKERN